MEISKKILDAIILISFFIISTAFIWLFKLNSLITTFLYLMIPSIYLLIRYEKFRKRILVFSLPVGIIGSIIVQYLAEYNSAWVWNSPTLRLATYLPLEAFIWGLAYVIVVLGIYKVFFDFKHQNPKVNESYNSFLLILFSFFLAFGVWIFYSPAKIEYAYARLFAIPIIAPIIYIIVKKPNLFPKLLKLSLVFLIFSLIYEIIALKLRLWYFPGEYSGFVKLLGVAIPLEEFILWICLTAASIAAYYETFADVSR